MQKSPIKETIFCKKPYNFIDPNDRSHPIVSGVSLVGLWCVSLFPVLVCVCVRVSQLVFWVCLFSVSESPVCLSLFYICVCVCVSVSQIVSCMSLFSVSESHMSFFYVFMCVCVCLCESVSCVSLFSVSESHMSLFYVFMCVCVFV